MKIRRFIITILVLIAFSSGGWSDSTGTRTSTANMLIKAFKVDSSNAEPELVITDALVSNLDQIPDGHEINLTDYVSKFLGSTSSDRTDFNSGVVFSYRVAGAKEGSYTLSFEFKSFEDYDNPDSKIRARFEVGNTNYIFSNSATNLNKNGSHRITDTSYGSQSGVTATTTTSWLGTTSTKWESIYISKSWEVRKTDNAPSGAVCSQWIARGAVALTIDSNDYNDAGIGRYRSEVKVIFTVGD